MGNAAVIDHEAGSDSSIRPETPADAAAIDTINHSAFSSEAEARLVGELRNTDAYVPDLSLVAEEGGRVAGHIMFFRTRLNTSHGDTTVLTLAPTAVVPSRTHRGIGTELVRRGLDKARDMGYPAVIEVGFPSFYQRLGFRPLGDFGLEHGLPVADDFMSAIEFSEGCLQKGGMLRYPAPFVAFYRRAAEQP
ncbi:MAG: GNAT family N-acetyltransferase [Pseudomonadota bacterium]